MKLYFKGMSVTKFPELFSISNCLVNFFKSITKKNLFMFTIKNIVRISLTKLKFELISTFSNVFFELQKFTLSLPPYFSRWIFCNVLWPVSMLCSLFITRRSQRGTRFSFSWLVKTR